MSGIDVYWTQPESLAADQLASLAELLDDAERARVARFADRADRAAFVAAHGMLRLALSAYADRPPREWRFAASAAGKPVLAGAARGLDVAFSLSHARSIVACAIAPAGPVGIDVEAVPDAAPGASLLALCCTPGERAMLTSLGRDALPLAFSVLWTMKEAALKALGTGLALPLDRVECAVDPPRIVRQPAGTRALSASAYRPDTRSVLSLVRPADERDRYPVVLRRLFAPNSP